MTSLSHNNLPFEAGFGSTLRILARRAVGMAIGGAVLGGFVFGLAWWIHLFGLEPPAVVAGVTIFVGFVTRTGWMPALHRSPVTTLLLVYRYFFAPLDRENTRKGSDKVIR
jgi:hypothetical protein